MCAWSAAISGTFGKHSGSLQLSRNYISFVKKKNTEKVGVVSDASDLTNQVILEIMNLTEMSFSKDKITLRDQNQKLIVFVKRASDIQQVRDILSTAKASRSQTISGLTKTTDTAKPINLELLLKQFPRKSYSPGSLVRTSGSKVTSIQYILNGTCKVFHSVEGKLVELQALESGDLVDVISAFLRVPSQNDVTSGLVGCEILEIPISFLIGFEEREKNKHNEKLSEFYFTLLQLMWNQVIRQEQNQIQQWLSQLV
jgi:hypothetical protein